MLKKKFRLSREALRAQKMFAGPRTPLFFIKEARGILPYSRFAVVVSKKIERRATRRNQIRRHFYRALHEIKASAVLPHRDAVIHVLPPARLAGFEETREALEVALQSRARLQK